MNNDILSFSSLSKNTSNITGSNKRKSKNSTAAKQNLKIPKIEETINMLKNRIELIDEEITDIPLDQEELNIITKIYNIETPDEAITEAINSEPNQLNNIDEYDDSEYINYTYNSEYDQEFSYTYEEEDAELEVSCQASAGHSTPGSDYSNQKGVLGGLLINSKLDANSPKKFIRKFNDEIRHELEMKFLQNNFISGVEKDQLAMRLNLTERQVKKWFEKRREKKRRIEKMGLGKAAKVAAKNNKVIMNPKLDMSGQVKEAQLRMNHIYEGVRTKAYMNMLAENIKTDRKMYDRGSMLNSGYERVY